MIPVGLRVDVDTLRGTCKGVPNLVSLLARHRIRASFFFSVGPDNMGRHLWRLRHPAFLVKMLRTRAARLYGWDILLRGTLGPGPVIGSRCPGAIRMTAAAGHEVGLHAWDHHHWQTRLERLDRRGLTVEIQRGYDLLTRILGSPPECFAAPGWRISPEALRVLDQFSFRYASDCRGRSLFRPVIDGRRLSHVQVPVTLPTFDELIGRQCTPETYNAYLLDLIRPGRLNVMTIHAEAEGISAIDLFREFLIAARRREVGFRPLGALLKQAGHIGSCGIRKVFAAGRHGWLAGQGETTGTLATRGRGAGWRGA